MEAGEDPAAVYCALGAAADVGKKLRHRYARLVALESSDEADVHILRREGAAHRCRFADGAEHVLSLRCRERAEDPHARPFRVLAEPPPWVLDQAAERAAARRGAEKTCEVTVFAGRAVGARARKDAAVASAQGVRRAAGVRDEAPRRPWRPPRRDLRVRGRGDVRPAGPLLSSPSGASLVITAFHKGEGYWAAQRRGAC